MKDDQDLSSFLIPRSSFPGGIPVHAVEGGGSIAAEIELVERSIFGFVPQLPLQGLPPPFVAGALDVALQLAKSAFVLVHGLTYCPLAPRATRVRPYL